MKPTSLQDFYEHTLSVLPDGIAAQMGHFNVFRVKDLNKLKPADAAMFYNRKSFFKIALLVGSTKVKYADTTVDVDEIPMVNESLKASVELNNPRLAVSNSAPLMNMPPP